MGFWMHAMHRKGSINGSQLSLKRREPDLRKHSQQAQILLMSRDYARHCTRSVVKLPSVRHFPSNFPWELGSTWHGQECNGHRRWQEKWNRTVAKHSKGVSICMHAFSIRIDTWAYSCVQTGQYSTQIFSLAVLLSSLFVYNQMGGIDEAALDRLSLVTEMTKHIRVRAGAAAGARFFHLDHWQSVWAPLCLQ